jgi:Ni,Fe-hydrogenase III small subunit/ferredoxin
MAWVLRGLREGVVTTRYPRQPDGYGDGYRAAVSVVTGPNEIEIAGRGENASDDGDLVSLCPTQAIGVEGRLRVDRGRCIVCGRCVEARPDRFTFDPSPEVATVGRQALFVPQENDSVLEHLRTELAQRVRALRRSIHIRHVDAGSDGAEEWEVAALTNPVYDVQRLGIFFTASPRHADLLLVTGVGTAGMAGPLRRTFEAMPDPRLVLAAGTDAVGGGLVHPSYATGPGVGSIVPVDVWVPGSPPSPFSLLHGILVGIGLLAERRPAT